jgi:hypothetical protein
MDFAKEGGPSCENEWDWTAGLGGAVGSVGHGCEEALTEKPSIPYTALKKNTE